MTIAAAIALVLNLINNFLADMPIFKRWFTKTNQQKDDEIDKKVNDESDNFSKTGRPSWED